ncbi:MAG: alpha/beta fold hydrolase [Acidimicrobiales bacterium]
MEFENTRLQIRDVTLNVVIEGHGPPVLLVHGFPDDHSVWRAQIPALVKGGFQVIAPDMRGCGRSDAPPERAAYHIDQLVGDLVGLLDRLGINTVRLVGHDWGAFICWYLCLRHPERIDRYAALSVGHPAAYARGSIEQKLKGYYVLLLQLRGLAEWALRARDWRLFRSLTGFPTECPHWIANLSRPGRLTAAINYYRANLSLILARNLPPATVPVMGIWSSGDRFLAEAQMRSSAHWVRGPWRYERIEGANHWLQLDAADQVNTLLLDYLR